MYRSLVVCCLAAFVGVGSVGVAEDISAPLTAGAHAVDITPPVGFRKAGGYTEVISTGIKNRLHAKAMVLRQGDVSFAIVICDLLSVPEPLSTPIRQRVAKQTGIPFTNIVVAATHNHASPEFWGSLYDLFAERTRRREGEDRDESVNYQQKLMTACVTAIVEADRKRQPVTMSLQVTHQTGIAFNRRFHMHDGSVRFNPGQQNPNILRPAGPVDPELPTLLFTPVDDSKAAPAFGLTVFAMHTATTSGRSFSSDFPGHMEADLRKEFGERFLSLFGEGTAGDINHVDVTTSERPTPEFLGQTLAATVLKASPQRKRLATPSLAVARRVAQAPFLPVTQERAEEAERIIAGEVTPAPQFLDRVAAWRDLFRRGYAKRYPEGTKPLEVQVIRLDSDTALVTLPHEVFVEIGMAIKAQSPFRNTIVISLANTVDYYIPTRRAFEEGSYEITTCPLLPGCGEMLVETALDLLNDLKP